MCALTAACRSNPGPGFQEDLIGTCWVLVSMDDADPRDVAETTLCFEEAGRINGDGGCNSYFASARFEGERLSIGQVGATRMACTPALMDQEQRYFTHLADVRRWSMESGQLVLHGEDPPPLRFERR